MNSLSNMMRGGMTTQPNGQPFGTAQQPVRQGSLPGGQAPQYQHDFGGNQSPSGFGGQGIFQGFQPQQGSYQPQPFTGIPRQPNQPDGSRIEAWKQAHPNFGQGFQPPQGFGQGRFQPPQFGGGNGYFDGDLGKPDWWQKPNGGW